MKITDREVHDLLALAAEDREPDRTHGPSGTRASRKGGGGSFIEHRLREMQSRAKSGPPISIRLSLEEDSEAERIAAHLGIPKTQLVKAGALAIIDGWRAAEAAKDSAE